MRLNSLLLSPPSSPSTAIHSLQTSDVSHYPLIRQDPRHSRFCLLLWWLVPEKLDHVVEKALRLSRWRLPGQAIHETQVSLRRMGCS